MDGKSVDINYVMIYTHGNQRSMIFESGSSTKAMSIDGKNSSGGKIGNINDLQRKKIKELNLLSCNAGNLLTYWNEGENLASALSKKVIGGILMHMTEMYRLVKHNGIFGVKILENLQDWQRINMDLMKLQKNIML